VSDTPQLFFTWTVARMFPVDDVLLDVLDRDRVV
jgi:hypothetical protein